MKKAAIIIVNWNGLRFLKNCLNSVYKQTYKNFDVYFVDNGSIDGSSDFVRKNFPKTKIVQLDKNYGFAKGNNEAIRLVLKNNNLSYIVCLNNDTIVGKNWLQPLIDAADKNKKAGSVQSKILLGDGKRIHTAGMYFAKDLQGNGKGGLSIGFGESKDKYSKEEIIFAGCGASILYKIEVLRNVGIFDEDFFAYVEDFDLGWRINKAGYNNLYCPHSKLIHFHSQTGISASPFKAYHIKRNLYYTAIKNMDFFNLLLFPFRDLIWNIKEVTKKNKSESLEKFDKTNGKLRLLTVLLKAYSVALFKSPKMLIKRFKDKKE